MHDSGLATIMWTTIPRKYKNCKKHYSGNFSEGEITGSGIMVYENMDKYTGSFKNGLR